MLKQEEKKYGFNPQACQVSGYIEAFANAVTLSINVWDLQN
jgi:hypothetical protein